MISHLNLVIFSCDLTLDPVSTVGPLLSPRPDFDDRSLDNTSSFAKQKNNSPKLLGLF